MRQLLFVLAALAACGDDGGIVVDAITVDIDNGSCGDQVRFTGEIVDWDTDVAFCGLDEALVEVQGGGGGMDTTAPNGRFDLCIPDQATTLLDVTPAIGNSQCTTPAAPYTITAVAVANKQVIQSGTLFSGRLFTTARQITFFQAAGLTFDPAKAHVFVHVDGAPRTLRLDAAHDAAQTVMANAWAPGAAGGDVVFPNVDLGAGTTKLSVDGGSLGTGEVPLFAGKITLVSIKLFPP